jgi:hypothetical protein
MSWRPEGLHNPHKHHIVTVSYPIGGGRKDITNNEYNAFEAIVDAVLGALRNRKTGIKLTSKEVGFNNLLQDGIWVFIPDE